MVVYTMVWGPFIDLFERCCLASLLQPGNLPAVKDKILWRIATTDPLERFAEIRKTLVGAGIEMDLFRWKETPISSEIAARFLANALEVAVGATDTFLMAQPDVFFGNGSIGNLVRYLGSRPLAVAAVHLRTLAHVVPPPLPCSNARLVRYAFENLHPENAAMFDGLTKNSTRQGGVSIRPLTGDLYTCVHSLSNVSLLRPTMTDVDFFRRIEGFGAWDHAWPSLLVAEHRLRVVGSSDLFFAVELTDADKVNCPHEPGMCGNDVYRRDMPHNRVMGSIAVVLRAER